ncbi:glycolate oxidase iron-sulfur subunit [Desulfohalotomaculum tongense]|uniref:(Fe-S)-binding protein n=1 Tax=Desulforadius tongensis TaxID=1216062 RepID=UPI00195D5F1E|nr:(Fe-S)-binding protein [Desulforadius tongensis]MBM7855032.1 glycolate oxidase iron-sulfur subunit [Desulforadius tongensis]
MSYLKHYPEIENEIIKCMKCGNCQAVCPLYKETKFEGSVARGKVKLAEAVLKGKLEYTEDLAKIFETCLTCKACSANCPCGVQPDKIVLAARAKLVKERGLPLIKDLIFKGLSKPSLFKTGMAIGSKTQGLFLKPTEKGMSPRYPVSGLQLRRVLPKLADRSFLSTAAEENKVDNPKKKVAFFTGCTTNFLYPQVGEALLKVMQRNNVEVVVPKDQHCCGVPVLLHGDVNTAAQMAKSHVDIFSKLDVDAIITVCGTCGESFSKHYPELLKDDAEYSAKANKLAEKTYDFAQFLVDILPIDRDVLKPVNKTVTYHVPCHIGRGMNAHQQQIELIKSIPGIKYIPLKQPDRCCGGAGSFSLTHYDLSYRVLKHKLADVKSTGADLLITGCGSCRMQLTDGIAQENLSQEVIHTVELLAKAY